MHLLTTNCNDFGVFLEILRLRPGSAQNYITKTLIYFGMYTGDAEPTGHWSNPSRRRRWGDYINSIRTTWNALSPANQQRGSWPRPDGPEMLCRWDMQVVPPDVLVTNYSMLEYMLVRPLEAPIFDATRTWLRTCPNACLTLAVLDEAHTYTGRARHRDRAFDPPPKGAT